MSKGRFVVLGIFLLFLFFFFFFFFCVEKDFLQIVSPGPGEGNPGKVGEGGNGVFGFRDWVLYFSPLNVIFLGG